MPASLPVWTAVPFVLLLLAIAVLPFLHGHWWEQNRNKLKIAGLLSLPVVIYLLGHGEAARQELIHAVVDYGSFILLLTTLYVVSSGIALRGNLAAHPATNATFLAVGAILANLIGTTGASMVLIRPLLRTNAERKHVSHVPIFFIFVVCNTGGLLTPLGDPPLFLGFLEGVDFTWTLRLWPQWLFVNSTLILIFYVWDKIAYRKEQARDINIDEASTEPLKLEGWQWNVPLLFGVVLAVLAQSVLPRPIGELLMACLLGLSLWKTPQFVRRLNHFSWSPILEVAVLFAGIFLTMTPTLILLRENGAQFGIQEPREFFWLTGGLSSVLDNAPTYMSMGTLAGQGHDLAWLSQNRPDLLAAVSCGAVMMGANTYIGNGPNFMVKAIAEAQGYRMPTFLGYMVYAAGVLLPIFVLVTVVFFR